MSLKDKTGNTVNVIFPTRTKYGVWVFDDEEVGLQAEPFVGDINTMIDMSVGGADRAIIYISEHPMANNTVVLDSIEGEGMYQLRGTDITGWLCPATLHYFKDYPKTIYAKIERL